MGDKLLSGSGAMGMALPIGLGLAAAAHPSLARGASIISNSMARAQRQKRLQEILGMQREEFEHKKNVQWPAQEGYYEARTKYLNQPHLYNMGGGRWGRYDEGTGGMAPIEGTGWEGTEDWMRTERFKSQQIFDRQMQYLQAQTQAQIQAYNQTTGANYGKLTPANAMTARDNLLTRVQGLVNLIPDFAPPEQRQKAMNSIITTFQPEFNRLAPIYGGDPIDISQLAGITEERGGPGKVVQPGPQEFQPKVRQAKDGSVFIEQPDGKWRKAGQDEINRLKRGRYRNLR